MKSVEFLSYKPYPNDQYLMGIATIRVRVAIAPDRDPEKLVLKFKHVRLKTGGDFFSTASISYTEDGNKKYADGAAFDSKTTGEELQDFLREEVRKELSMRSAVSPSVSTNSVNYNPANPLNINGISAPAAKAGSSSQDDLPF